MKPTKSTHKLTEHQYGLVRSRALEIATVNLPKTMNNSTGQTVNVRSAVTLTGIGVKAKANAHGWHSSTFRRVDWPWMKSVGSYAWFNPKRFELAIRYNGVTDHFAQSNHTSCP